MLLLQQPAEDAKSEGCQESLDRNPFGLPRELSVQGLPEFHLPLLSGDGQATSGDPSWSGNFKGRCVLLF